ncbi:bifunctional diguanylate cyclase/phosphodiesterase [Crocosphaera sp. Alani8]|uniref:bifunctional diguanylate cyclase/phosphodiesterase n=1 Tax=Crocosphaera sp. Alani8 TaxID=3038952 RepID=UPI00313CB8CC
MQDKFQYQNQADKKSWEPAVEAEISQQKAIGEIAQIALNCSDIDSFLQEVTQIICDRLQIHHCGIFKRGIDDSELQLIQGVGWNQQEEANPILYLHESCHLSQTVKTGQTLIVEDFTTNDTFACHPFLANHSIMSGISAIIPTSQETYGILGVYNGNKREYSPQESNFLEIIAQIIGTTISQKADQQPQAMEDVTNDRFFELNLDICCIAGFDGYFKKTNAVFTQTLGYSAEELKSKPLLEFVHPDDRPSTLAKLENLSQNKQSSHCENRYRCRDGSYRWLSWTSVVNLQKKLIYAVGRDVTESKNLELALRKSEEKFRLLFAKSPTAMGLAKMNGKLINVNQALCELVGYRAEELLTKGCVDITHPEDIEKEKKLFNKLLSGEINSFCLEKRYITKTNQIIYGLHQATLIRDIDGNPLHLLGQTIDITQQIHQTVALQESEERLASIISTISDGLLVINPQGKVRFINDAGVRIFGRSATDLIDHPLGLPVGNDQPTEIFIQQPEGNLIIAQMRVANITWQGQSGYLVSLRDITENYEAQEALSKSEKKYRQIVETATEGIWIIDQENKTSFVNQQMAEMLGYKIDEIIGKDLFDFVDLEENIKSEKRIQKRSQGTTETNDVKFRCRDGGELWTIVSSNPLLNNKGNYVGSLSMITDISQRKKMEQALSESEQRLEGILNSIQDMIWSFDGNFCQLIYINPVAQTTLGFSLSEIYNNSQLWRELIHPDDQELVESHRQIVKETGYTECKYRLLKKDGQICWLLSRIRCVYNEQGNIIRIDGIDSDITEQKEAEEQLQYNATHDPLTNLPNRILFMDRLEHAIQRQKRYPKFTFAVLFLDLDEFKVINDSLGHAIGDQLLKEISHRLQEGLRSNDTLARLGGDEFTILLEDIENIQDAINVAKRIHLDLKIPFILQNQNIFINTSIGIALSSLGYEKAAEILRDADTAMYRAKADGKACYAIFDREMHERAVSRLQLETDLRIGISQQEFSLYYQPIICLKTGQLTAFEALIRWNHSQKKLISPAQFIPVAEETGLIISIGEWTLKEACQQMRQWQDQFPHYSHLKIGVNLSSKQLKYSNLINTIDNILQETNLEPKSLKLEITETLLMENLQAATNILLKIQERDIEICLDDFGTGYSSLSYLHRFPVNTLKIDRSFVMRMEPNNENAEIVRAIVSLAHILGLDVIAEGIETELQLAQLKWLDCEQGQGYFFAKPLPASEVESLLKKPQNWDRSDSI